MICGVLIFIVLVAFYLLYESEARFMNRVRKLNNYCNTKKWGCPGCTLLDKNDREMCKLCKRVKKILKE